MSWQKAKERRLKRIGGQCEVCGKYGFLIGHHVVPRAISRPWIGVLKRIYGSEWEKVHEQLFENVELTRLRHRSCEEFMHHYFEWGNTRSEQHLAKLFIEMAAGILHRSFG